MFCFTFSAHAVMRRILMSVCGALFGCCVAFAMPVASMAATAPFIILQSTTSTQNSGLYDYLLPRYEAVSGVQVRVVAVGTGQAIINAKRCDGDILIVHSKADEMAFIAAGYGKVRHDLMYNDFVLLGPADDPANIRTATNINMALHRIVRAGVTFASRGDNSGTHKAERQHWTDAGLTPSHEERSWYLETGRGMGTTLNFAVETGAYTLSDRATWLAFGNKRDYRILFEGDPALFNQYGVIPVSPEKCKTVKYDQAKAFTNWLISPAGQAAIASYSRDGNQLFFPNARQP